MLPLLATALAVDCPTPLTEDGLRAIVDDAKAAIDAGDPDAHERASFELETRVPCLVAQLPRRPWADYLVTYALVRHVGRYDDWNEPLSVALDLVPDHPDVPAFIRRDYLKPERPAGPTRSIPDGVVFVLDGRILLDEIPPLSGLHIVQTVADGRWTSLLLDDEPLPDDFIVATSPEPEPEPPRLRDSAGFSWGMAGLGGGAGGWTQSASPDDRIGQRDQLGAQVAMLSTGQVDFGNGDAGLFWDADLSLQASRTRDDEATIAPFGSGFVGAGFLAPVTLLAGVGLTTVRVEEDKADGPDERPLLVPHYVLGASLHTTGALPADVTLAGGFGPAIGQREPGQPTGGWGSHALFRAGIAPVPVGSVRLRIGLNARWARATLGDQRQALADREPLATASTWRAGLDLGLRWGD